ncbi:MAG: PorP/SprF family type IX secretion system membrane protein [Bacteroidales bacterium]|nr:PorP/SprF family type IX secretion system membrane protein [Bacteroidales bacterium]
MCQLSGSRIWLLISVMGVFIARLAAQELPVFDLYLHDNTLLNPAFRGRENCRVISLADHHQWLGIKDAPNTQVLNAYGRFYLPHGSTDTWHGLGIRLCRDVNGAYQHMNLGGTYAFHVRLPGKGKTALSMGIEAMARQYILDQTGFGNIDYDPVIGGNRINAVSPAFNLGIALYHPGFYAGITVADLLPPLANVTSAEPVYKGRHYFLTAGQKINSRSDVFIFEPSMVIKMNESLHKQIDIGINISYRQKFWFGLSYRHNLDRFPGRSLSLIPFAGYRHGNFQASYAFLSGFNPLTFQSYGSHELMLSWRLCRKEMHALPCPVYDKKKR